MSFKVFIPLEPDESMIRAGCEVSGDCERAGMCYRDCKNSNIAEIYKAMVKDHYSRVRANEEAL